MKIIFGTGDVVINASDDPASQFAADYAARFVDPPGEAPAGLNVGWRYHEGSWVAPEPPAPVPTPEPEPVPAQPILYAAARLKIEDYDITGIEVQSRFAGAFWIDVGKYCVFFAEPQPDTEYMAMASAGPCQAYVLEEEKDEAMFTITVTNAAGEPVEASFVNISIVRVS